MGIADDIIITLTIILVTKLMHINHLILICFGDYNGSTNLLGEQ